MDSQQALKVSRNLTFAYMIALTAIAVSSIISHVLLDRVIDKSKTSGAVINISGKQRMLSQRIDIYAHLAVTGNIDAKRVLNQLVDEFENAHNAIIKQDGDLGLKMRLSNDVKNMYFNNPIQLDKKSREFIASAREILESDDINILNNSLKKVNDAATISLLPSLDKIVHQFTVENQATVASLRTTQKIMLFVLLSTLALEANFIFRPLVQKIKWAFSQLFTMAMHDVMTNIPNRRYFMDESKRILAVNERNQSAATFMMLDIDHFKKINDSYGHDVGDKVIKATAEIMQHTLRGSDLVGRLGGEEFGITLPDCDLENAKKIATKLLHAIADATVRIGNPNQKNVKWTISIGLTQAVNQESVEKIAKRADEALYKAKHDGRNQYVII